MRRPGVHSRYAAAGSVSRDEQRRKYDQRRRRLLPRHSYVAQSTGEVADSGCRISTQPWWSDPVAT